MGFLSRLFKRAPVDPSGPLTRALESAQALQALPAIGGDDRKDRALVGLIGNLQAAQSALASGKDDEGIPISPTELADRLRRTHGYLKQHGIWDRLLTGAGRDVKSSLRELDKDIELAQKALREWPGPGELDS